jgi:hypothetical protein
VSRTPTASSRPCTVADGNESLTAVASAGAAREPYASPSRDTARSPRSKACPGGSRNKTDPTPGGTPGRCVRLLWIRRRAGWVRRHAMAPGGAPHEFARARCALSCYPTPSVENGCSPGFLGQYPGVAKDPGGGPQPRMQSQRGVPGAVSARRGLVLPGLFDAQPSQGREWLAAAHEAGPPGPVGDLTRCRIVPLTPALSDPLRRVTGPKLLLALPLAPPAEPASLRLLLLGHDTATLRSCPSASLAVPRRSYSPRSSRTVAMRLPGPMPASRKLS